MLKIVYQSHSYLSTYTIIVNDNGGLFIVDEDLNIAKSYSYDCGLFDLRDVVEDYENLVRQDYENSAFFKGRENELIKEFHDSDYYKEYLAYEEQIERD